MQSIEELVTRALATLREVTAKLSHGVNKDEFEQEYRGKFISPGVSVRRHLEELRISGNLEESGSTIKLKRSAL
jgi:hypothetical protein